MTADNTAAWPADFARTLSLTESYTVQAAGLFYLGICEVAGTPTTLAAAAAESSVMNIPPVLVGQSTSGLTNAASAPATAASFGAIDGLPYAFVS